MNVLILYANPSPESLNAAILRRVQRGLSDTHAVRTIDLYQEHREAGFDPCLTYDAEHLRRDLVHDPEVADYREAITWADQLIVIYPIWWGGMPAVLKGFIDRVFVKGFAYDYQGLRPQPLLTGKRAWVITTHDTPAFFARWFAQDYGRVMARQVLGMCGFKPVTHSQLAYIRGIKPEKIQTFLDRVETQAKAF